MKFIRNIGRVRFRGYGADLHVTDSGAALIQFNKCTAILPMNEWLRFDTLALAERFIAENEDVNGLNTLLNVLNKARILR